MYVSACYVLPILVPGTDRIPPGFDLVEWNTIEPPERHRPFAMRECATTHIGPFHIQREGCGGAGADTENGAAPRQPARSCALSCFTRSACSGASTTFSFS